jgi:CcmD family protein
MLGLDQYGPYLATAFGITLVVLVGYLLYLRSRLTGAKRRQAYSARNVADASPRATAAQTASNAKGPSAA